MNPLRSTKGFFGVQGPPNGFSVDGYCFLFNVGPQQFSVFKIIFCTLHFLLNTTSTPDSTLWLNHARLASQKLYDKCTNNNNNNTVLLRVTMLQQQFNYKHLAKSGIHKNSMCGQWSIQVISRGIDNNTHKNTAGNVYEEKNIKIRWWYRWEGKQHHERDKLSEGTVKAKQREHCRSIANLSLWDGTRWWWCDLSLAHCPIPNWQMSNKLIF